MVEVAVLELNLLNLGDACAVLLTWVAVSFKVQNVQQNTKIADG